MHGSARCLSICTDPMVNLHLQMHEPRLQRRQQSRKRYAQRQRQRPTAREAEGISSRGKLQHHREEEARAPMAGMATVLMRASLSIRPLPLTPLGHQDQDPRPSRLRSTHSQHSPSRGSRQSHLRSMIPSRIISKMIRSRMTIAKTALRMKLVPKLRLHNQSATLYPRKQCLLCSSKVLQATLLRTK